MVTPRRFAEFVLLLPLFTLAFTACTQSSSAAAKTKAPATSTPVGENPEKIPQHKGTQIGNSQVIKVEGMTCGGCEMMIGEALEKIDSETECVVSHEEGQVQCVNANADFIAQAKIAIQKLGYKTPE